MPIEVQPLIVIQDALKLFEAEIRAQDIELAVSIGSSYKDLGVERVFMDPSRIVQILFNFLANAIKFTKGEDIRRMTITVNASTERPSTIGTDIKLVPSGRQYQDLTSRPEWGSGEIVYLSIDVNDTGAGLSEEDMVTFFHKFTQAMPRTHARYGGSGLGLFISQCLAELQGGEVGIASKTGVGSSFFFYIKARHAIHNPETVPENHSQDRKLKRRRSSSPLRVPRPSGKDDDNSLQKG